MKREKEIIGAGDVGTISAEDLVTAPVRREVRATMVAVHGRFFRGKERAKIIEEAMSDAIREAMAQGITDPNAVRKAMMAARARAIAALDKDVVASVSV